MVVVMVEKIQGIIQKSVELIVEILYAMAMKQLAHVQMIVLFVVMVNVQVWRHLNLALRIVMRMMILQLLQLFLQLI